ncbi:MAG: undecaprenyldiphospho-muramoylpentapeptide beta-N-acetylglucosaminyltransferase [Defluviitaleaceae bacterium]|nr:undecaprenyldiphospho-muramoylpentapeptide beta-N-acetylglucosaminyltransferase [Defluviitaleaceae bacterium]MCL2836217.1 undecaprenyldiphospho-muramoylpentapeptide beta-N-acetylglucosaminyltransferase [Defluviitaleaceae bacterium]
MKKIILTGGGSAGHVTPNLALAPVLREAGFDVEYIGGKNGMERALVEQAGIPYHGISTGKLRRDKLLSLKNLSDMFGAAAGVGDSIKVMKKVKPDIIFSKGGFVGLPVAIAARMRRVPLVLHESDLSSGLANRLSMGFAKAICASFPETMQSLPPRKAVLTGNPIRKELLAGNADKGRSLCGFAGNKPVILMMGGSLGSERLNNALISALPKLLQKYDIIHICGRGKMDGGLKQTGYAAFEYLGNGLGDVLDLADVIVSRAGSNALNEFLALRKPSLLIPLARATRGDQIQNARSFAERGFAMVLDEQALTSDALTANIDSLYRKRHDFILNMEKSPVSNAANEVVKVILNNV